MHSTALIIFNLHWNSVMLFLFLYRNYIIKTLKKMTIISFLNKSAGSQYNSPVQARVLCCIFPNVLNHTVID